MLKPQTCKKCGRIQYIVWSIADSEWRQFCFKTGWDENKTICLECFAELNGYIDMIDCNIMQYVENNNLWRKII